MQKVYLNGSQKQPIVVQLDDLHNDSRVRHTHTHTEQWSNACLTPRGRQKTKYTPQRSAAPPPDTWMLQEVRHQPTNFPQTHKPTNYSWFCAFRRSVCRLLIFAPASSPCSRRLKTLDRRMYPVASCLHSVALSCDHGKFTGPGRLSIRGLAVRDMFRAGIRNSSVRHEVIPWQEETEKGKQKEQKEQKQQRECRKWRTINK